jgi:hypothetical protein
MKAHAVTVIPKKDCPTSLNELRNISLTNLWSKVFEKLILNRIRCEPEDDIDVNQY